MLIQTKTVNKDPYPLPTAEPTRTLRLDSFKTDLAWHDGAHPMESWHFATNLRGDGRHFSFRVQMVIIDSADSEPKISVGVCLLDQDTGWVREVENTVPLRDITIASDILKIKTSALDVQGIGSNMSIKAELPDVSIDLSGAVGIPILINNGEGSIDFLGAQQYKFAIPGMHVSGFVSIMGKSQTVTGAMWVNRQWGDLPNRFSLERNLEQRQWICLYPLLSNGISLSATQLWDFESNRVETSCTVVLPDGTHIIEKIQPLEMSDFMESRLSGRKYPRHVGLTNESLETCLQISLPYKEREVVSKMGNLIKFDGKMVVDGFIYGERVTGDGFVEMVGRWK